MESDRNIRNFDETRYRELVNNLTFNQILAFLGSCCERLVPNYRAFSKASNWGNTSTLERALLFVWKKALGTNNDSQLENLIGELEGVTPNTETEQSFFVSQALDASCALIESLEFYRDRDVNHVLKVIRACYESMNMYLQVVNDPSPTSTVHDRDYVMSVDRAPLMQVELNKIEDDINLLSRVDLVSDDTVRLLQKQACGFGIQPFRRGLVH